MPNGTNLLWGQGGFLAQPPHLVSMKKLSSLQVAKAFLWIMCFADFSTPIASHFILLSAHERSNFGLTRHRKFGFHSHIIIVIFDAKNVYSNLQVTYFKIKEVTTNPKL